MNNRILGLLFGVLLAGFCSCRKLPDISEVSYVVSWKPERPYRVTVEAEMPGFEGGETVWQRPYLRASDHRRGWIETDSSIIQISSPDVFLVDCKPGEPFRYAYTFLLSDLSPLEAFRNSRFESGRLFLQNTDIFCIPRCKNPDQIRFRVRFDLPPNFPVFTQWVVSSDEYLTDFNGLINSFTTFGACRQQTVLLNGTEFIIAIDASRPAKGDESIQQTLRKSVENLSRRFPDYPQARKLILVQEIPGNLSLAMRRGKSIVLGLPREMEFDLEARNKLIHEIVHSVVEIEDDSSWFEEGIAEYLSWATMVRSGMASQEDFFRELGQKVSQIQNSGYKGSLIDAATGRGGMEANDFLYSMGMLGAFSFDVEIRCVAPEKGLEQFLNFLRSSRISLGFKKGLYRKHLVHFGAPGAMDMLEAFGEGDVDIENLMDKAGLSMISDGYTLISLRNDSTGYFPVILAGDRVLSIDMKQMTKEEYGRYMSEKLNQEVQVQIERSGAIIEQRHKVVARQVIKPSDWGHEAIWKKILRP